MIRSIQSDPFGSICIGLIVFRKWKCVDIDDARRERCHFDDMLDLYAYME